jgi:hypothetical protein
MYQKMIDVDPDEPTPKEKAQWAEMRRAWD